MFAQHSQSSETYTRYSDGEDSKHDPSAGDNHPTEGLSENASELTQSQQLLHEVLGETLVRNQENPAQLVRALQKFRGQHSDHPCDEALFVMIAQEVLRHRLGTRSSRLPRDLFEEVGGALWTNATSRDRIERFWHSLGAET